jgi:hypothetical protein
MRIVVRTEAKDAHEAVDLTSICMHTNTRLDHIPSCTAMG